MSDSDPDEVKRPRWRGTALAAVTAVVLAITAIGLALTNTGASEPKGIIGLIQFFLPTFVQAPVRNQAYLPIYYQPVTNTPSPTPPPTATPMPVTPPASGDWPTVLSYYRASARLPGLAEDTGWSAGALAHARYMVKNDVLSGSELPATPWYTDEGAAAGPNSNLLLSDNLNLSDQQALDYWMAKPFHALGLLDPALLTTGFGVFHEDAGNFDPFKTGAAIDVRRGLGSIPGAVQFPIKWPEHNSTVYLTHYDGDEQPDPLSSCSGYNPPSGLPIILQLGPGSLTPVVTAHSFKRGGASLPHCLFSETDYNNSIEDLQNLGRGLLNASDAIVLIPQQPITPAAYTVSITANGQTSTWTFNVVP